MNSVLFCVFATFIVGLNAAVYHLGRDPNNSDHPGHCNSNDTGLIKHGETKTIPWCVRAVCYSDGSIELASCGVMGVATPTGTKRCYPIKDSKKPYPDCCDDCTLED
ncbi:uncharacterized protein [Leptinotarsa decemlineata]|uniref:uncharacterized protein n=1 Tax=Leptinotarsa decemlineata TaxID=7539 RepID=UPI003D309698